MLLLWGLATGHAGHFRAAVMPLPAQLNIVEECLRWRHEEETIPLKD